MRGMKIKASWATFCKFSFDDKSLKGGYHSLCLNEEYWNFIAKVQQIGSNFKTIILFSSIINILEPASVAPFFQEYMFMLLWPRV